MPVYRMRDGKDQLPKNDKTFADSIKVLENNFALALFPEAAHSGKRQMLAHKKAVPRIVFMAEEKAKANLDIHIIPVGIYYSSYWKFNRNVIVNFGKPLRVNDFLKEYHNNVKTGTLKLRDAIYNAIEQLTINIESKAYYNDFEYIRKIYGRHFLKQRNKMYSLINRFYSDQILTKRLDKLETRESDKVDDLVNETRHYKQLLKKYKLRDWLLENPGNNLFMLPLNKLVLLLGLPLFLFGFLGNAIPFFTIDTLTRMKTKDQAFWSTFFLGLGLILFPIMYLLELWAVWPLLPWTGLKLLFLFCLPLAGKLAFRWYILLLKTLGRGRIFFMKIFNCKTYQNLQQYRHELFDKLDNFLA